LDYINKNLYKVKPAKSGGGEKDAVTAWASELKGGRQG